MATVIAALIGAAIGSVGSQVIAEWFRRRDAREQTRREASEKYLLQLQDAIESVISRVVNLKYEHGLSVMAGSYYEVTTLYAFGVLLAQKRRLLLDGIYPKLQEIESSLGEELEDRLEAIESDIGIETIDDVSFQRYQRLALAESVMERVGDSWTVVSYLQFADRVSDPALKEVLAPAFDFVRRLDETDCGDLLRHLEDAGDLTSKVTGLRLSV